MKPFHEVQAARRQRAEGGRGPGVFRSSMLVPRMDAAATQISFLNHFLIKRGIGRVALKISAIDEAGRLADKTSRSIEEPIAYTIDLDQLFGGAAEIAQYNVEFFSSEDLVVPYPAAMINHVGADFINVVHAYNRVLNDAFEDEAVNKVGVLEASIDVPDDADYTTFVTHCSGPLDVGGEIHVMAANGDHEVSARLEGCSAPLGRKVLFLRDAMSDATLNAATVIKVAQPRQRLFYGRMLAGVINRRTGAFSANHSYYDCSSVAEYFDNSVSRRVFPFFAGFHNALTLYPIMSPGAYEVCVNLLSGGAARPAGAWPIESPRGAPVSISVGALVEQAGASDCTAFEVVVTARDGGRIPTRVMHQLHYGDGRGRSPLHSSIAVGLINEATFIDPGKAGVTWGQMVLGADYRSRTGFCFDRAGGEEAHVAVQFYGGEGLICERAVALRPGEAFIVGENDLPALSDRAGVVWFMARSSRADLAAQSFHVHARSGNASGEHSF